MLGLLLIYSSSGTILQTIDMRTFNTLQHIVEQSPDTLLVCQSSGGYSRITAVQKSIPTVSQSYYDSATTGSQFVPVYKALDLSSNGWVFVADSINRRLVVLDKQLKFVATETAFFLDNHEVYYTPQRLSYNSVDRILLVVDKSAYLSVYSVEGGTAIPTVASTPSPLSRYMTILKASLYFQLLLGTGHNTSCFAVRPLLNRKIIDLLLP